MCRMPTSKHWLHIIMTQKRLEFRRRKMIRTNAAVQKKADPEVIRLMQAACPPGKETETAFDLTWNSHGENGLGTRKAHDGGRRDEA